MQTIMNFHKKYYSPAGGLFILRLAMGTIFIYQGVFKFTHLTAMIGFFGTLGLAPFFVYLVAIVEIVGGACLILGLGTRFFAKAFAIIMIVALILVSAKLGNPSGQLHWLLLASSITLLVSGCGKYSICAWRHKKDCADGHCQCQHEMKQ